MPPRDGDEDCCDCAADEMNRCVLDGEKDDEAFTGGGENVTSEDISFSSGDPRLPANMPATSSSACRALSCLCSSSSSLISIEIAPARRSAAALRRPCFSPGALGDALFVVEWSAVARRGLLFDGDFFSGSSVVCRFVPVGSTASSRGSPNTVGARPPSAGGAAQAGTTDTVVLLCAGLLFLAPSATLFAPTTMPAAEDPTTEGLVALVGSDPRVLASAGGLADALFPRPSVRNGRRAALTCCCN